MAETTNRNPHASKARMKHPAGWEPGTVVESGDKAVAVSQLMDDPNPEHSELIRGWQLDPNIWEIDGPVNCRRWQTYDERWLYYYKANLVRREKRYAEEIEQLTARVLKRSARVKPLLGAAGERALVVNWADWQVGKGDGDGVSGTRDRLANMIGQVEDHARNLYRAGSPVTGLYVNGLGDLGEGCGGHYAQQTFRTVLNVREQRKMIRWAIDSALDSWSRKFDWIAVRAVGGNHGEERQDGKSYTDFADNRDVAVFEDVMFAYDKNQDRYGHVSFYLPHDDLTLTFEHEGTIIGLAHGHQAGFSGGGGDPARRIANWWAGQMVGQQKIGDADILITGHYHHPWMRTVGKRVHFGCPALDGGSDWWRNTAGIDSPPGTLTFVIGPNGWSNFEIL